MRVAGAQSDERHGILVSDVSDDRLDRDQRRRRLAGFAVGNDCDVVRGGVQGRRRLNDAATRTSNTVHCDDVVGLPTARGRRSKLNCWCRQATNRAVARPVNTDQARGVFHHRAENGSIRAMNMRVRGSTRARDMSSGSTKDRDV